MLKVKEVELNNKDFYLIVSYENNGKEYRVKTNELGTSSLGSAITEINEAVIKYQRTTEYWFLKVNKVVFAEDVLHKNRLSYSIENNDRFPFRKTKASFSIGNPRETETDIEPDREYLVRAIAQLQKEIKEYVLGKIAQPELSEA